MSKLLPTCRRFWFGDWRGSKPRDWAEPLARSSSASAATCCAPADDQLIEELTHALRATSIYGLGQVVSEPIASVLKHFREEVEAHITRRECPSGVCFASVGSIA